MTRRRVLLSFSGGLDTSFCVVHLAAERGYDVSTVTFDCGGLDEAERDAIAARSEECGATEHRLVDLKDELCRRVLVPLIRSSYLKGGNYPLCVGAERGLQAATLARLAAEEDFDAVAHGCTAAGNDQVRFDVTLRTLLPDGVEIVAPIRDLGPTRPQIATRLRERGITVEDRTTTYSVNTSLWGTTLGGGPLHDPATPVPGDLRHRVPAASDVTAPDEPLTLDFAGGVPVALDAEELPLPRLIETLDEIGARHGIGRDVHLGDTVLGIKGRVVFEAPAAALIHHAHRELMKLTLGKWQLHLRQHLLPVYGQLLHEGLYLDPVMGDVEAYLEHEQRQVEGSVTLTLSRGRFELSSVDSPRSRMRGKASYGETGAGWDGRDTAGFSRILSLGLRANRE